MEESVAIFECRHTHLHVFPVLPNVGPEHDPVHPGAGSADTEGPAVRGEDGGAAERSGDQVQTGGGEPQAEHCQAIQGTAADQYTYTHHAGAIGAITITTTHLIKTTSIHHGLVYVCAHSGYGPASDDKQRHSQSKVLDVLGPSQIINGEHSQKCKFQYLCITHACLADEY